MHLHSILVATQVLICHLWTCHCFMYKGFLSRRKGRVFSSAYSDSLYENGGSMVKKSPPSSRRNDGKDGKRQGSRGASYVNRNSLRMRGKGSLEKLAEALDEELYKSQWFVTGNVKPQFFDDDFSYEDRNVQLCSLDEYATDVRALFDQSVSRADVLSTVVNYDRPNTITCTWRLSGRVNLLRGLDIKPFYVCTDFIINEKNGLIVRQQDRYSLPLWDILLSAVCPFFNGILTAPEAPPVPPRIFTPDNDFVTPFEAWASRAGLFSYFSPMPVEPTRKQQKVPAPSLNADFLPNQQPTFSEFQEMEIAAPNALQASNNDIMRRINSVFSRTSETRPVTPEEARKIICDDTMSPLLDWVKLAKDSFHAKKPDMSWYFTESYLNSQEQEEEPEIRAILADGTIVPAIRSPTWQEKAKLYFPNDRAEVRASLNEATVRAKSRRYSRHYRSNEEQQVLLANPKKEYGRGVDNTLAP